MSEKQKTGSKGYALEEVLRAYFLRAGFFVIRGAPYIIDGEELTDIDLWLYERSSSTARRCQIVDIKSKTKPKAIERIVWTKGLMEILDISGAYVATTDNRIIARKIANKLNVKLLDGTDIKRIQESEKVLFNDRLTEEQLSNNIRQIDKQRRNKQIQTSLQDLKSSPIFGLGASSLVRCLEAFEFFARNAVEAHPNSDAARIFGRLSYLSASFIAFNLDYIGAEASFRTNEERRSIFVNAIRYGNPDRQEALRDVRISSELIRKYVDNGNAIASILETKINKDLEKVPAEIIADQVIKSGKGDALFNFARALEQVAYSTACPSFDALDVSTKSFFGALLDFCFVERASFASCWHNPVSESHNNQSLQYGEFKPERKSKLDAGPLFRDTR